MPDEEKQLSRLGIDGFSLVRAGTETMGSSKLLRCYFSSLQRETLVLIWIALSIITYHLLSKPHLLAKLRAELLTVFPDKNEIPPCTDLEKLPYLISQVLNPKSA